MQRHVCSFLFCFFSWWSSGLTQSLSCLLLLLTFPTAYVCYNNCWETLLHLWYLKHFLSIYLLLLLFVVVINIVKVPLYVITSIAHVEVRLEQKSRVE